MANASAVIEDSYFHDYFQGDNPIIFSEDASSVDIRRCKISNYYEVNLVRTLSVVEDCLLQFMTADGIDFIFASWKQLTQIYFAVWSRGFNIHD